MGFEKEYNTADEYFYYHLSENREFMHIFWRNEINYFIKYKSDDKFDVEKELEIFKNYFTEYDLKAEGWKEFNYRIDQSHSWPEYDFELCIYSVRK